MMSGTTQEGGVWGERGGGTCGVSGNQMILEKMPDRSHKAQASRRSLGHGSRTGEGLRGQPQGDDDVPSDDERRFAGPLL
jgi:hypothetical protein